MPKSGPPSGTLSLVLTLTFIVVLNTYKTWGKIYKSPIGCISSLVLSISKHRKELFRNIKVKIILEVFKRNHMFTYEKEYWRFSCWLTKEKLSEEHQNYLFKHALANQVLSRRDGKPLCQKRNAKSRHSTICLWEESSVKGCPEINFCHEEINRC